MGESELLILKSFKESVQGLKNLLDKEGYITPELREALENECNTLAVYVKVYSEQQ